MDDSEKGHVLIAGGGITGLAMRRALQQRGIPSLTLERRLEAGDAGLAINLPGNAVQALGQLGSAESLRQFGSPVRRREYRTEHGRLSSPATKQRSGAQRHGHVVLDAPISCAS